MSRVPKKTDDLFSKLVRERSDYSCDYCNRNFRHEPGQLHCSHLFGRARQAVRIYPLNSFSHCFECHPYFEQRPDFFKKWAVHQMGQSCFLVVERLSNVENLLNHEDLALIHQHFMEELIRLQDMRAEGAVGRLEFTWPQGLIKNE